MSTVLADYGGYPRIRVIVDGMAEKKTEIPSVDHDGWISADLGDGVRVHLRPAWVDGGRVVTDVLVRAPDVTTDVLRRVRPSRLVGMALHPSAEDAEDQRSRVGNDDSDLTLGELRSRSSVAARRRRRTRSFVIGRPTGQDPDQFYQRVAYAYSVATSETGHPAKLLADLNEVPVETVRRWIKEARRRGFLPPGRQGRAG
jgi:hypothetical protein